ncbi:GGDEF domain-containing phosphodiesterase [Elstera cyanobacteriorum]|uniref:EAL domain-containing protein n=1 Tax=Elstera cyanobacteriorum TaxID=2022747 RepID=UPI0023548B2C|nr:GGDEF domain-containing phosphodiesterase [Elstera cyanobacteriorum]MCK6442966.1 EAL domain-containing protein [Elstera cyanobacteriorum]
MTPATPSRPGTHVATASSTGAGRSASAGVSAAKLARLREDRARLLAFSFSRAELLLEVDADMRITYCFGASYSLTGMSTDDLLEMPLINLLAETSRHLVKEIQIALANGLRMRPQGLFLKIKDGRMAAGTVAGFPLPERDDRFYLSFANKTEVNEEGLPRALESLEATAQNRDRSTGLLTQDAFTEIAARRLKYAKDHPDQEPLRLTMVDLHGVSDLGARLDQTEQAAFQRALGALLSSQSQGGDSAVRLSDDKYGVLHDANVDSRDIKAQVEALAKQLDPEGEGIHVIANELKIDMTDINVVDASRALIYAVTKFTENQKGDFTVTNLNESLGALMKDTVARVTSIRDILASHGFSLVFHPIVDLKTRRIHHQEALSRLPDGSSPFETVTFAEQLGMVTELDLSICRQVLKQLDAEPEAYDVAVNISGGSFESELFVNDLDELLRRHPKLRRRLLIEITESASINDLERVGRVVDKLRAMEYRVCIDDFGAGAAALHYLRAFKVDVVKLDGVYVKNIQSNDRDRMFVRAILQLCKELGIETTAEMIETEAQAAILTSLGVTHGQGYLFYKPNGRIFKRPAYSPIPDQWDPSKTRVRTRRSVWE